MCTETADTLQASLHPRTHAHTHTRTYPTSEQTVGFWFGKKTDLLKIFQQINRKETLLLGQLHELWTLCYSWMMYSGMLRRVAWNKLTDYPEYRSSKHLWNVDQYLPEYNAQHLIRQHLQFYVFTKREQNELKMDTWCRWSACLWAVFVYKTTLLMSMECDRPVSC